MQDLYESTDPVQVRFIANKRRVDRIKDLIERFEGHGDVIYSRFADATDAEDDPQQAVHVTEFVVDFTDGEGFRRSVDALVSAGAFEWQALAPYSGEI